MTTTRTPSQSAEPTLSDAFDELAALFLTDTEESPRSHPRDGRREGAMREGDGTVPAAPMIELLLVGHLPVRASLWPTPYVDRIARGRGPSALVRLDQEAPVIELVRAEPLTGRERCERLREALRRLRGRIGTWVLRDRGDRPPQVWINAGFDRITILTSADDAAAVHTYQLMKTLAVAAEDAGTSPPAIGIAVVGAHENQAREMTSRLNQAASRQLGLSVSLVACLPKLDAAMRLSGHLRCAASDVPEPGELVRILSEPRPDVADRPEPVIEEMRSAASVDRNAADHGRAKAPIGTARPSRAPDEPSVGGTNRATSAAENHTDPAEAAYEPEWTGRRTVKLAPKPSMELESREPARSVEPDEHGKPQPLTAHVPGLAAIRVRCPGRERVELAVDESGRLHLLGREQDLRDMRYVEAWARQHGELLTMACPDAGIDALQPVQCHVFAERPTSVSDLHGTPLQLHVLAPVDVDGRRGWYSAPLNA